jgi:hypothetical protein
MYRWGANTMNLAGRFVPVYYAEDELLALIDELKRQHEISLENNP